MRGGREPTPTFVVAMAAMTVMAALLASCGDGVVSAFSVPAPYERPVALLAPKRVGFDKVADALVATCGTLDCHGQPARNLRLYGSHSMRLRPTDDPGSAPTTAAERDADFWSVTGLEPEITDEVVRAGGDQPERLSLYRKGLGIEKHKGGTVAVVGGALDLCLRAWLQGRTDETSCRAAVPMRETIAPPETPPP
jgi:hypothetical protein